MFELRQLQCFVAVATELNFRRAAERLNMTQPPLSRQVQLLEHQLGVQLLERSKRSVRLTAAGRSFFHEAQSLLERAELAALTARKLSRGDGGSVALGLVSGAVYDFLPRVVVSVQRRYPDIELSMQEMNTFEQLEALRARRIDMGIVRSATVQREFEYACLVREPFVLAIPKSHPLAEVARPEIGMLDREPLILYSLSGWQPFYELLSGAFRSAGVEPNVVQYIGSTLTILALVNAGMGVALVPQGAASLKFDDVVFRPIELGSGVRSELHLVWRDDSDNPARTVVLEALKAGIPAAGT